MGCEIEEKRCVWADWMMLGMRKQRRRRGRACRQAATEREKWGGVHIGEGVAVVDGGRHDVCFHGDGLSVSHT